MAAQSSDTNLNHSFKLQSELTVKKVENLMQNLKFSLAPSGKEQG